MKNYIKYKLASYMVKDVKKEIMGDRNYNNSYLTGELAELIEAIREMDKTNIKEEFADSSYAAQMLLHQKTGLNFPMVFAKPSVDKFRNRNNKWRGMFETMEIPFSENYLIGGSNIAKPEKIRNAFRLAGKELTEEELKALHIYANS